MSFLHVGSNPAPSSLFKELDIFILKPEYKSISFIFIENFFSLFTYYYTPFFNFFLNKLYFSLNITSNYRKIIFNLATFKGYSFLNVSPGFFFWKLNLSKSFKKSNKLKIIQLRFLKKFFSIISIRKIKLTFFKSLKNYRFIINNLIKPINHFFVNPISQESIILSSNKLSLDVSLIVFLKQITFFLLKKKKKSRLKRKILKKLIKIKYLEN